MSLYKEKYRIESCRLQNWDYGSNGKYFITICTKSHTSYFGEIVNNQMIYSKIGNMAYKYWKEIPDHFPFVLLDQFVIMPNHVHGIIVIDKKNHQYANNKFGPQSKNMASIIRGFKIGVTKYANNNNILFFWQSRFYDHIVRSCYDLHRIQKYIIKNPSNWKIDKFYRSK